MMAEAALDAKNSMQQTEYGMNLNRYSGPKHLIDTFPCGYIAYPEGLASSGRKALDKP